MKKKVAIKNKRARFEYELLDTYTAGIVLAGSEIKSIRQGKAAITDSFCEFNEQGELFVINMHIEEYAHASHFNHSAKAPRKLLLNAAELKKLRREVTASGLTMVPLLLFINERGLAKLKIALARGKKTYDKRASIKERDIQRNLDAVKKGFNRR